MTRELIRKARSRELAGFLFVLFASAPVAVGLVGPEGNLLLPPGELIERFRYGEIEIVAAEDAGGGIMGAKKLKLAFPREPHRIAAKWKATPEDGDGWNNSPRREIAAYAVQKLFLDPEDFVVPPVASRCVPLDAYRVIEDPIAPNLPGTSCVYGTLSAWLQNVHMPDTVFDRDRFTRDRRYAVRFAHVNLLTYLIAHRDRNQNFLVSDDPADPHIFSIDNGIAFGVPLYNFWIWHFDEIRVGGFPRAAIKRLRAVTAGDLARLGVLEQLEVDSDGVLQHVSPGANWDPDEGTRLEPGRLQIGLTEEEIEGVGERLQELLEEIDEGEWKMF